MLFTVKPGVEFKLQIGKSDIDNNTETSACLLLK